MNQTPKAIRRTLAAAALTQLTIHRAEVESAIGKLRRYAFPTKGEHAELIPRDELIELLQLAPSPPPLETEGLWDTTAAIRKAIRDTLHRRQTTQTRLAEETGLSQGHISAFLRGRQSVTIHDLDSIAEASGVRVTSRIAPEAIPRTAPANRAQRQTESAHGKRARKQPADHPFREETAK